MIEQKKFTGNSRGRDPKYAFNMLEKGAGYCLVIPLEGLDPHALRQKVSTALYQWKKYNSISWKTAVRLEGNNVSVYRIS